MGLSAGIVAVIVIGSILVLTAVVWWALGVYTWKKASAVDPLQTRVKVDPREYSGKWYEIARFPQTFEKNCVNVTAEYEVTKEEGGPLRVTNRCQDASTKKWRKAKGWAHQTQHDGVFAVSFFPGIYGNYTVVKREADISVVSNPDRTSLWILSRRKSLSKKRFLSLLKWLQKEDYDTELLQYPIQQA